MGAKQSHYYRKHLADRLNRSSRVRQGGPLRDSGQRHCLCCDILLTTAALMILLTKLPFKKKNQLKHSLAQPRFISFPLKTHCSGTHLVFLSLSLKTQWIKERFHCMRTAENGKQSPEDRCWWETSEIF